MVLALPEAKRVLPDIRYVSHWVFIPWLCELLARDVVVRILVPETSKRIPFTRAAWRRYSVLLGFGLAKIIVERIERENVVSIHMVVMASYDTYILLFANQPSQFAYQELKAIRRQKDHRTTYCVRCGRVRAIVRR